MVESVLGGSLTAPKVGVVRESIEVKSPVAVVSGNLEADAVEVPHSEVPKPTVLDKEVAEVKPIVISKEPEIEVKVVKVPEVQPASPVVFVADPVVQDVPEPVVFIQEDSEVKQVVPEVKTAIPQDPSVRLPVSKPVIPDIGDLPPNLEPIPEVIPITAQITLPEGTVISQGSVSPPMTIRVVQPPPEPVNQRVPLDVGRVPIYIDLPFHVPVPVNVHPGPEAVSGVVQADVGHKVDFDKPEVRFKVTEKV